VTLHGVAGRGFDGRAPRVARPALLSNALLSTIGPMRKGRLWETTAMPEIRGQALELADQITASMEASSARLAGV